MVTRPKEQIWGDYQRKMSVWVAQEQPLKELREMGAEEAQLLFYKAGFFKKDARETTGRIMRLLEDQKIMTMTELAEQAGVVRQSVYRRIDVFREYSLVRVYGRSVVYVTPRFDWFVSHCKNQKLV